MILYLDSSEIVKLYVEELGSARVEALVALADGLATSRVAYAEVRSALARKRREGGLAADDYSRVVSAFRSEWARFVVVEVTQQTVELAGDLSGTHALRSLDAIHLASAKLLGDEMAAPVSFSSSDKGLKKAAVAEGMAAPELDQSKG